MNLGNHHVLDSLESSSANQLLRSNLINRYTLKRRSEGQRGFSDSGQGRNA